MYELVVQSPAGPLTLTATELAITGLHFGELGSGGGSSPLLEQAAAQLEEYFAGSRRTFDLPLAPAGTPFQRRVWDALREIPYGKTVCYRDIAARVGCPKGFRAVGLANNRNPISIFIPCHRVVGADGSLTGYGGGLSVKKMLLDLEARESQSAELC